VTFVALPGSGQLFLGWQISQGGAEITAETATATWANPLKITLSADTAVGAVFAPRPSFPDVAANDPTSEAIAQLSARGIIRGQQDGRFGPDDNTLRAQMAALIARAMGWESEDHGNRFQDRGSIDAALWQNVGTLAFYNVARGYADGTYGPTDNVLQAQTISFITRAMVTKGYWTQQLDDPRLYPNITADSGHRADISTFVHYAGALPGTTPNANWAEWNQPATRAWFAEALWQALNSHFGGAGLP
jgi:hypothetical protein